MWARSTNMPGSTGITAGSVTASNLLSDLETQLGATLMGCTIMRVRGLFQVNLGSAPAVGSSGLTMALKVTDRLDVALPAAQLLAAKAPGSSDRYGDWMSRAYYVLNATGTGTGTVAYANQLPDAMVDYRARRKLDEQQDTLVMFIENHTGSVNTMNVNWALDILLAMP